MDPWNRQDISGLPRQSVREYAPPNDGEMEKTRAREIEGVSSWIRERRMLEINKKKMAPNREWSSSLIGLDHWQSKCHSVRVMAKSVATQSVERILPSGAACGRSEAWV
jgi:hypothetical protein